MDKEVALRVLDKLPLLITTGEGAVRLCNRPAAKLLGCEYRADFGRPCWELVHLDRLDGASFCKVDCAVRRLALAQRSAPHRFVLSAAGSKVELLVFLIEEIESGEREIVHLLIPLAQQRDDTPQSSRHLTDAEMKLHRLSQRELQILHLLASGHTTTQIASELFISVATVRNHVQHILGKLGVHRRLEAIVAIFAENEQDGSGPASDARSSRVKNLSRDKPCS